MIDLSIRRILYLLPIIITMVCIIILSDTEKISYSAPSIDKVNHFIAEHSINAIAVKEHRDFTVVLYQKHYEHGHYILYEDSNKSLHTAGASANGRHDNPVGIGIFSSGKTPYVAIFINDDEIFQKSTDVDVIFSDGTTVNETITSKGIIIINDQGNNDEKKEQNTFTEIIIYDKDRNILYQR